MKSENANRKRKGKASEAELRIVSISDKPAEYVTFVSANSGSTGLQYDQLPICKGTIAGLPDEVDALIIASDLQGVIPTDCYIDDDYNKLIGEELPEILLILMQLDNPKVDLSKVVVILCGDLFADPTKRGSSGDPLPVWEAFSRHFGMVIGVAGNHDLFSRDAEQQLASTSGVQFFEEPGTAVYAGMTFAGVGGIIGRADKPNRMPEQDYLRVLNRLLLEKPDVLLLHQGPDDPASELKGHAGIRKQIEAGPPLLVCCGHVHWEKPLVEFENGTQVLNADGRVFLLTPS